jgi:hypothetical protein
VQQKYYKFLSTNFCSKDLDAASFGKGHKIGIENVSVNNKLKTKWP